MDERERSEDEPVDGRAPWNPPRLELLALADTTKTANASEQTITTSVSTIFLGPS